MLKRISFTVYLPWMILTLCLYLTLPAHADNSCPISIPTSPGNVLHNTCESSTIAWNDSNSTEALARNSSRVLTIIEESGTGRPYTWSVSGTGFSLKTTDPMGTSSILYTDGTACGSAKITVTGCNGKTEVIGYVRSNTGRWILISSCNKDPSCLTSWCTCTWYETKYKHINSFCTFPSYTGECDNCAHAGTCGAYAGGGWCSNPSQYCRYHAIYEWECN